MSDFRSDVAVDSSPKLESVNLTKNDRKFPSLFEVRNDKPQMAVSKLSMMFDAPEQE